MHDAWIYLAIFVAGLFAGFANSIAGGGSFLTLPALMLAGLPIHTANGSNRVAVLLQGITAATVFHRKGVSDTPTLKRLAWPACLGAIVGAFIAAYLPKEIFEHTFGVLMIIMAIVMLWKPKMMLATKDAPDTGRLGEFAIFLLIGIYAGFIQAGAGLLMLVGMRFTTQNDLVKSNAVKNMLGVLFTVPALAIFWWYDQVHWGYGLLLGVGNIIGAYAGAHSAIKGGAKFIFAFVVVVMVATGVKMLWPW